MIVSAEMLEECETAQARRLGALRRGGDEEVRVVMVIRDLISLTPSSYSQMVKTGQTIHEFDAFFQRWMRRRRIDYFETAQRWADAFGWQALRVRPLDTAHLLNGELIDDFLEQADIDLADPRVGALHRRGAVNVGPGWRVVEAIRALYAGRAGLPGDHPLAEAARLPRERRETIGRIATRIGAQRGWNADKGRYLTLAQAEQCLATYEASLGRLNGRLADGLPLPLGLEAQGFAARDGLPGASQVPPAELRAFYDDLAGAVLKRWPLP
jgi:hypothetical protein